MSVKIDFDSQEYNENKKRVHLKSLTDFNSHINNSRLKNMNKNIARLVVYGILLILTTFVFIIRFINAEWVDTLISIFNYFPPIDYYIFFTNPEHRNTLLTLYLIAPLILLIFNSLKDVMDGLNTTMNKILERPNTTDDIALSNLRNSLAQIAPNLTPDDIIGKFSKVDQEIYTTKVRTHKIISWIVVLIGIGPALMFMHTTGKQDGGVLYFSSTIILIIYLLILFLAYKVNLKNNCLKKAVDAAKAIRHGEFLLEDERNLGFSRQKTSA